MAGFIRRYSSFPTLDVITEIEGTIIVDQPPPAIFTGLTTGTVLLVGEWPGGPFNKPTLVEGDRTISGVFGGMSLSLRDVLSPSSNPYSNGNSFPWCRGKKFKKLILVRPDMATACGVVSVTLSDTTISGLGTSLTTVAGTTRRLTIPASSTRRFLTSDIGKTLVLASWTGNVANNGSFVITAVGANGLTADYVNAAGTYPDASAGSYAIKVLATDLVIPAGTRIRNPGTPTQEFALAQSVTFAAGTDLLAVGPPTAAWTTLSDGGGAVAPQTTKATTAQVTAIPVYSTQNLTGALGTVTEIDSTDLFRAGIGTGAQLFPDVTVAVTNPAALLATPWVQATVDAQYQAAINAALPGDEVVDDVTIVASARQSDTIRTALQLHVANASAVSRGRVALVRPPIGTATSSALASPAPGVGATRSDRVFYCYPHFEQNIPEIATLDPAATISGPNILVGADAAMATICSNLAPEENPGQSTADIASGGLLAFIRKLEDGLTTSGQPTKFVMSDYINFKAAGIAALRRSSEIAEWVFQSGVTSVDPTSYPNLAPISRRRFADYVQDSVAAISLKYNKKSGTTERFDSLVGEQVDFLDTLLAPNTPPQQRIEAYSIDTKSGNSAALTGSGVRVIIEKVRMLGSLDYIVLQTEIGATVTFESFEQPA